MLIHTILTDPVAGREIPAEVAARTDEQNNFPPEMWKKLGEAGYYSTPMLQVMFPILIHESIIQLPRCHCERRVRWLGNGLPGTLRCDGRT